MVITGVMNNDLKVQSEQGKSRSIKSHLHKVISVIKFTFPTTKNIENPTSGYELLSL